MENQVDYFYELPDEIFMMIFSYLKITDATNVFNTCERFARIMCDTKIKDIDNRRPLTITNTIQVLYKNNRVWFNEIPNSPLVRKLLPLVLRNRIVDAPISYLANYPAITEASDLTISLKSSESIPNILGSVGTLTMIGCDNLTHIGVLANTNHINMRNGAKNLVSISDQPALTTLIINGCPKMSDFSNVNSLRNLNISKCDASKPLKLPPNLVELSLSDSKISKLVIPGSLKILKIDQCPRLSVIESENNNNILDTLLLDKCPNFIEPGILKNVRRLEWVTNKSRHTQLHHIINSNLLADVENLSVYNPDVEAINAIKTLKNLKFLQIYGSETVLELNGFSNLDELVVKHSTNLTALTHLANVKHVTIGNCPSLTTIGHWVGVDTVFISVCDKIADYSALSEAEDIRIEFMNLNGSANFEGLYIREKPIKKLMINSSSRVCRYVNRLKTNLITRWGPDLVQWYFHDIKYFNIFQ